MKTIAFTDDFAILIGVNKKESIEYKLNNYMNKIVSWCTNIGLQIATDKTEIIILSGMRIPKVKNVNIRNKTIIRSKDIKYLGIIIDNARRYTAHIEAVCGRADALAAALKCLLLNVNSPSNLVRRLYYNIYESEVLYASPLWVGALKMTKT